MPDGQAYIIPADLPAPIDHPSAWRGPDLVNSTEWAYQLSASDIAEIDAAIAPLVAREADIAKITQADFPLPTLGPKLTALCNDVIHGRGFALMRGLPVERYSIRESATAYFGVGTYFGNARSQNAKGHVLGHVQDLGLSTDDPKVRIYQTTERQTFHTDSTDIVALLCLKTSKSGGLSSLVSTMAIYNEMYAKAPDLLWELFQPFATDRRGEIPEGKGPYFEIPVYNHYESFLSVIYARRYIESARRLDGVPPLTARQTASLDMFDDLANSYDLRLDMDFKPGDMQWVHNHTNLHDRTAFEDWPEPENKRHLLRLWLATPGARPLPPIYAERYGQVDIGDRGGIIVPGAMMKAPLQAE